MAVGLRQADNVKIANLTIINCNIERLYGDIFRNNQIVKIIIEDTPIRYRRKLKLLLIMINDNDLCRCVRDIRNDTFYQIGDFLEELHLVNTRLQTLPVAAFQQLKVIKKIIIDRR